MRTFVLFIAAVAAVGAAYFLHSTEVATVQSQHSGAPIAVPSPGEAVEAPLVQAFDRYKVPFQGSADLIARRQKLHPFITVEGWDRLIRDRQQPARAETSACSFLEPAQAIFVSPAVADSVAEGRTNIVFVSRNVPRCFKTFTKLAFGVDDLVRGKKLFDLRGEITVNRVYDKIDVFEREIFFSDLQIEPNDAMFLANSELAPSLRQYMLTAIHISFAPTPPALDRVKVPNFVTGAEAVHAESVSRLYNQDAVETLKPILVDARDRKYLSAGVGYEGAILVPFVSSNPLQVQYRPDLLTTIIAGAKFDTTRLPASRDIPLVIFGNDEHDATPLWVIRYLRLMNYRNLYYVVGGLKAMNALKEPIVF